MNIIMLGPPNSGKGTQSVRLAEKLGATHFSAGDLIRDEIETGSDLGKKFEEFSQKGVLIPGEFLNDFFELKIKEIEDKQIVFDGFPRQLSQVRLLEKVLPEDKFIVININVKPETLLERMSKRRVCSNCDKIFIVDDNMSEQKCDECGGVLEKREDDNLQAFKNRINVYIEETKPVLEYFRSKHDVIDINGEPKIEIVEQEIWEKLNDRIKN